MTQGTATRLNRLRRKVYETPSEKAESEAKARVYAGAMGGLADGLLRYGRVCNHKLAEGYE